MAISSNATAPDAALSSLQDTAQALLDAAKAAGAEAADALATRGESLSVAARDGAFESVERSESVDFGLRVLLDAPGGRRQATVSASDPNPSTFRALAERAVAMAREAPLDAEAGLAPPELHAGDPPDLDLWDAAAPPSPEALLDEARAVEAAALEVSGVSRAEGAETGWSANRVFLATSAGFSAGYATTNHGFSVSAIAGEGLGMERDYAYTSARHRSDLRSAAAVGREAGERAIRRLNPRKARSGAFPVIFEARLASGLVGSLLGAVSGEAVARGASFLKDKMGEAVLPRGVSIIDDPHRPRGAGSKPFDGEGVAGRRKTLFDDGVLSTWLLDLSTAKRLGMDTNGSARRGVASPPSPGAGNAWMTAGTRSVDVMIAEIDEGLLVTEMMGRGVNMVTGDYSRGATGFWIEKGEIAYPVSEITVAGAMLEMMAQLEPADDLKFEKRIEAPSLRISGLTVASGA